MAISFANITGGSWTGFADADTTVSWLVSIFDGTLATEWETFAVTESGSATEADPHAVYRTSQRKDYRVETLRGFLKDGSGNYIRLAKDMNAFAGGQIARISAATVVRRCEPQNVTAGSDTDTNGNRTIMIYRPGIFTYQGSYEGWIQGTETPIGTHITTDPNAGTPAHAGSITLPMGTGDLSGNHIIQRMELGAPFRRGGPVPFRANFVMTGTVTRANTPFEDFSATLGEGFGDMAINLSNGATRNATWLFNEIQVDLDYQRGGPVPVRASAVANGEVT